MILVNPMANGECGTIRRPDIGPTDPQHGLRSRDASRLGQASRPVGVGGRGIQHELMPRVGLDVGYFRRTYGDFTVTDNTLTGVADYTQFSITAPTDSRLPEGGRYTVGGLSRPQPEQGGSGQQPLHVSKRLWGLQGDGGTAWTST